MTTTSFDLVDTRALLLPYALSLVAAMTVVQIVIAITDGIGLVSAALTAAVAVGIVVWLVRNRRRLSRVRFGWVVAHTVAFVTVVVSFTAHAIIVVLAASANGPAATAELFFGTSWFGVTLVTTAAWGTGLLVHLIGSVLGRGWDD